MSSKIKKKIKKGGANMPTSSIFQNIILTEKEEIEAFAKALEESEKYSEPIKDTDSRYITDPEELSELVGE